MQAAHASRPPRPRWVLPLATLVSAAASLSAAQAMAATTPVLTSSAAAKEASAVLTTRLHVRSPRIRGCRRTAAASFKCVARWTGASARVSIARERSTSEVFDHYVIVTTERARARRLRHRRLSGDILVAAVTQPGSGRGDPLPFGATAKVGDWQMQVLSTTPDATAEVLSQNTSNTPPAAGRQFYIARLQATYVGTTSASFGDLDPEAVGPSAVAYTTFSDSCGVIPDPISANDVFPNGTVVGNVCWSVRSGDAAALLMYVRPSYQARATFFSLNP